MLQLPSDGSSLFIEHRGSLIDYATGIMGSRAQAEDVVQEAWVRFQAASRERFFSEPLGYLYRIVRNLALDGRRRSNLESRLLGTPGSEAASLVSAGEEPTPEVVAVHREELRLLTAALAELPRRTRIAVEMHRLGGCTLREIAEFLGISQPLAHKLVMDGIRHCKRQLRRQ
jgi:RNA polymerase sigma-70 factor (ECF subfamily)